MRCVFSQFYKALGSVQLDTLRPVYAAQEHGIEQRTDWLLQGASTEVPQPQLTFKHLEDAPARPMLSPALFNILINELAFKVTLVN